MSLREIQVAIAKLRRAEQEELYRFLGQVLVNLPKPVDPNNGQPPLTVDRKKWLEKLARLRALTAPLNLPSSQPLFDEMREDRV